MDAIQGQLSAVAAARTVIGIAVQSRDHRLSAVFAKASGSSGDPGVAFLSPWRGGLRTAIPDQLFDFHEVLLGVVDEHRPSAIAVRRVETGGRGGPSLPYDEKVALQAMAMLTAKERSVEYDDYRKSQLAPKPEDAIVEQYCPRDSRDRVDSLQAAALAAALTKLGRPSPVE